MLYLSTGGNGASKTLFMLFDVRAEQLRSNRPVFFNGFTPKAKLTEEFGWKEFEPPRWNEEGYLPDGAICILDEAQKFFPAKVTGELQRKYGALPQYIDDVASDRRKRGLDWWVTTPHPMMIHPNLRRLIADPSWHRHHKRILGTSSANVIRWNYANIECEKPGASASGEGTIRVFPSEVYEWYHSASLHTGKVRIPKKVYVLVGAIVVVAATVFLAYRNIMNKPAEFAKVGKPVSAGQAPGAAGQSGAGGQLRVITAEQYVSARQPRLAGFPHTAPIYDGMTSPAQAPFPAACVAGRAPGLQGDDCRCWTQQATPLQVPRDVCMQIAKTGFFMDWLRPEISPKAQAHTVSQKAEEKPPGQQVWVIGETPGNGASAPSASLLFPGDGQGSPQPRARPQGLR